MNNSLNLLVYSKNEKRNLNFGDKIDATDSLIISIMDKDFKNKYIALSYQIGVEIYEKRYGLFSENDDLGFDEMKITASEIFTRFIAIRKNTMYTPKFYILILEVGSEVVKNIDKIKPILFEFYINEPLDWSSYNKSPTVKTKVYER